MVVRISTVLEAITTTILLHSLYGKKYVVDIKTILFIALDLVIFQGINEGYLPKGISAVIYIVIVAYCMWEFKSTIKAMIVNVILYVVLLGSMQMICIAGVYCILPGAEMKVLILGMNIVILFLCVLLFRRIQLRKLSYFFQQRDIIIKLVLLISVGIIIVCVYLVQTMEKVYYIPYVFVCIASITLCIMAGSWEGYKIKAREREAELEMFRLYGDSFENLLLDIRLRQHEFNNHISAVFSQHLTCSTYEELVKRQREYCGQVLEENKYEKLLISGNSVLTGFLYGKFLEAEKRNIEISYSIETTNLDVGVPDHKIIELIGNFFNNAMDALETVEIKKIHMEIYCSKGKTVIEIRNTGEKFSEEEFGKMFKRGYSNKGTNRGLGLYNVKRMGKEYGFEIVCENKYIKNENWISFAVMFKSSPDCG